MTTLLLLSGGTDSAAIAFWKKPNFALTIDYGQLPSEAEIRASQAICDELSVAHRVVKVDCRDLGSGMMAGNTPLAIAPVPEWWPFRNQFLVTVAAMHAVSTGADTVLMGTVRGDSQHADGTLAFIDALSALLSAQEGGVRLSAPAIHLSTPELIRASGIPLEILAWAHSCHVSNYACGKCRGCEKHRATMKELGFAPY